jgi:DNA-binding response OmpR family regulator
LRDAKLTPHSDPMINILLIDDDMRFCRLISTYLSGFGFVVVSVHNGVDGKDKAMLPDWRAIILDVMLPQCDGYEVLRSIRRVSTVPVLMLTAMGDEADRIVGLEMGADDYLPKTASPRELLARLRALLRRSVFTEQERELASDEIVIGPLEIDTLSRTVSLHGEILLLTPVEYDLLLALARNPGVVRSRESLMNEVRDRNYDVCDRSIDMHISGLRKKLRDDPKYSNIIKTVRSAGYMLNKDIAKD